MRLSHELQEAIRRQTKRIDQALLARASAELTRHYKAGGFQSPALKTAAQRAAYLAVRFPATYAANGRVFAELRRLAPQSNIGSMLDLGAGPGTALFAAAEIFPSLRQATLIESDAALVELGRSFAGDNAVPAVRSARWLAYDLRSGLACDQHDLVVMSYVLGELPLNAAEAVLRQAWNSTKQFLVVLEPGTPRGFGVVHTARSWLISAGVRILAPCPHTASCPLAAAGDWCHFAQRVQRTSQHRQLKGGTLGYEDEKFSYIVACREDIAPAKARILRHPRKHAGHVQLTLCTPGGIQYRTVAKSQREQYRLVRGAEWGDPWETI